MKSVLLLVAFAFTQCLSHPAGSPPIDWDNLKPLYPTFTPWDPANKIPREFLRANLEPPQTKRMPGYKKGTKSMADVCGNYDDSSSGRIVGGEEATPHSFPWMAALFIDEKYFCGGTIISDEWVLTAGHCCHDASSIRMMLGAHNVREASEEGRIEVTSTEIYPHEGYTQLPLRNDICVVHFPSPINFTDIIQPICLPLHSETGTAWDHEDCVASGWGKPSDSSNSISPELRRVDVDTITNLICALEFPGEVTKQTICISGRHGKSTCNGDSGGPLHLPQGDKLKQIGITSFGSALGCELGFHAAFTRTAHYLDWIETTTGIMIDP